MTSNLYPNPNPNPNSNPISSEGGKIGSKPEKKKVICARVSSYKGKCHKTLLERCHKGLVSQRLLFCTKANCDELPSASWTPTLSKLASNSWFKVHAQNMAYSGSSPMDSSPSQPALSEVMINAMSAVVEKEKPSDGKLIRARRIRIFPTPDQKIILPQWFGTVRFL